MAERPTPEAVFKRWLGGVGGVKPTIFYGAPTGFAGMLASPQLPAREEVALRLVSSAGEALPAEIGERFKRHFGVDIVDGIGSTEMLHIFISNRPDRVRYGSTGWPVPGYDIELRGEDGRSVAEGEPGDLYVHGPSAALMYWGNRAKTRDTFEGRWTRSGDKYIRNARRDLHLRRALGRHAQSRRRMGQPGRGRGDARPTPVRLGSCRDRRAGC